MKAVLLKIALAFLIPFFLIFLLYKTTDLPNFYKNGFDRRFFSEPLIASYTFELPPVTTAISGMVNGIIYLTSKDPTQLLAIDTSEAAIQTIKLPHLRREPRLLASPFITEIDSSGFKIFSKNLAKSIIYTNRGERLTTHDLRHPFHYARSMNDTVIVYRVSDASRGTSALWSHHLKTGVEDTSSLMLAGMGTKADGQIVIDSYSGLATYIHYYHNQAVTFDHTLQTVNIYHTIDTVSFNGMPPDGIPLITNHTACVYKNRLFVASNLIADNEKRELYFSNIPIDIYDTTRGSYEGSIYIPVSRGRLLKSMIISSLGHLICLYHSDELMIYRIPQEYFTSTN